jgi:ligand-binding SRPBCC domain-containing protein
MSRIEIITHIRAAREIVFDLSLSVDLHKRSTEHTHEEIVGGVSIGLMGLNETVTWRAKHLGFFQQFTTKITALDKPCLFVDEMQRGAFKSFRHAHHFEEKDGLTRMVDVLEFESPFGILGKVVNKVFLKNYLGKFLEKRNRMIQFYAESDRWKEVLLKDHN